MSDRQAVFDRLIEDFDEKQLPKVLDFKQHRFVTVERDSISGATFVQGHKSMRGACNHLARAVEGCERFVPERVVDLDSGEVHELDVWGFVAPKSVDAVAVLLPRQAADFARQALEHIECDANTKSSYTTATKAFDRALERRPHGTPASTD